MRDLPTARERARCLAARRQLPGASMMRTRNTARRVIPLRETVRKSAKPRAKKSTPSFSATNQLEQVISRLQTLVSTGEAEKVDEQLEQLLRSLGLDPASPAAWRDGFL